MWTMLEKLTTIEERFNLLEEEMAVAADDYQRVAQLAQERSVGYVLLDPSPKVSAIIELSQLQDFFTIETTD